ncbi:MAG: acyloxyacyl hydrolase [Chthoniobacterales bacterium]|nr:acyloxyacyl hydrolase [Chthoniobacterales bacterium]
MISRAFVQISLALLLGVFAGALQAEERDAPLDPPSFQLAVESGYMLGFRNPNSYEVAAQFLTARVRWGVIDHDSFWRGYQQAYLTLMGEPFVRGLENHYFGISSGLRYNFVRRGSRFSPYASGGVGLGWVDATKEPTRGALGQDFSFNVLGAAGVSYRVSERMEISAGLLYQHLSNAAMSEPERPNAALNSIGPQLGLSYGF